MGHRRETSSGDENNNKDETIGRKTG